MNPLFNLKGKTAWITGGKRVGIKVAETLAQHGADLVISYNKSKKEAQEAQEKSMKYGVKVLIVQTDVSSRKSVENAVSKIKKEFGRIDIMVLMASIFSKMKMKDVTEKDMLDNFKVHALGTFWPVQLGLGLMARGSHVITISDKTVLGKLYHDYFPYNVAKGTVAYMTRALAYELAPKGIFINSIAPGPVLKSEGLSETEWKKIRKESMISYSITDEEAVMEFAKLVLYLSTARSTGFIYPLDFGTI